MRKKCINTSLKDLSVVLNDHGRNGLLSFISHLPNKYLHSVELTNYITQLFRQCVLYNISLVLISMSPTIKIILSKFHSLTKV